MVAPQRKYIKKDKMRHRSVKNEKKHMRCILADTKVKEEGRGVPDTRAETPL